MISVASWIVGYPVTVTITVAILPLHLVVPAANIGQYTSPRDCSVAIGSSIRKSKSGTANYRADKSINMLQQEITIINKLGLHARAAAKFVSCTSAFSSKIMVGQDGNLVDGKSIMSIMMLAAAKGTLLEIQVDGADEEDALAALIQLIENRFDEDE